ncbi:hypothetical protein BGX28_007487 [Mortierella sp. GBA30]|nr:hypothetical protein BGX28_007487 [Mortierella sp. GBA30]
MSNATPLRVLIVGADIATLTLALILEQAGVDYLLLESQASVPVIAGGVTLHPTVLPFMEQLSLRDDLLFTSQPLEQVLVLDSDMETITSYDWSNRQTRYSAWSRFMSRPEYCGMIVEKLPESKILFSKSITSVTTIERDDDNNNKNKNDIDFLNVYIRRRQDSILDDDILLYDEEKVKNEGEVVRGVTVECSDGSVYSGHILIGDVNSSIRNLVREDGIRDGRGMVSSMSLAAAEARDAFPMREVQYHVSGITESLDPQRIPLLREDTTQLRVVMDEKNALSWWAATLVDSRIAWQVTKRIILSDKSSRVSEDFGSGPLQIEQASATIISHLSHSMLCPLGGTMAQLVSWTSPADISCTRWDDRRVSSSSDGICPSRVLLIGDACRKNLPILGQVADESILDALALSEALFSLRSARQTDD